MRLGVRGKLFLLSLVVILGVIVSFGIYLEYALSQWLESRIASELERHAESGRVLIQAVPNDYTVASIDPLADRLGRATSARITVISDGGQVLGDSQLSVVEILLAGNQGNWQEVLDAKRTGVGLSKRYSTLLETTMLFVAIPLQRSDGQSGFIRAAMSLEDVEKAKVTQRWVLLLGGLFALGAAVSMSGLNAHFATRTLRTLVRHIHAAGGRKLGKKRIRIFPRDEIGGLAGSFNKLAGELEDAVEALNREKNRMRAVLEGMSEGVVGLNRDYRITLVNQSAMNMLNLTYPPIGKPLSVVTDYKPLLNLAETPGTLNTEFDLPGRDEALSKRVCVQRTPTRTRGGCAIVLRDVTEIHRQEQIRRDFVANVSHELRTPVAIILANSETLLDGAFDDPVFGRTLMEAVERHAFRLSRIITDLLDLSRLESGRYDIEMQPVKLSNLIARVADGVGTLVASKHVSLNNEVPEEMIVMADSGALEQILFNLMDNAAKYTPENGKVFIRAKLQKNRIRVEVEDSGPGIPPKHHPRVFERFYRVDPGRSQDMGGTGLGLPIVKRLTENMGGLVGLESVQPQGVLFWFTLERA
ncbi:MAG: PAS domain-containing protein [Magnetococcales bacterium]|nr:PAS domain-containing protein [Magnetococcales bacterium]